MDAKHFRLTPKQSAETRESYKRLLQLSRDRHAFGRLARQVGWCPAATKELWETRMLTEVMK